MTDAVDEVVHAVEVTCPLTIACGWAIVSTSPKDDAGTLGGRRIRGGSLGRGFFSGGDFRLLWLFLLDQGEVQVIDEETERPGRRISCQRQFSWKPKRASPGRSLPSCHLPTTQVA